MLLHVIMIEKSAADDKDCKNRLENKNRRMRTNLYGRRRRNGNFSVTGSALSITEKLQLYA